MKTNFKRLLIIAASSLLLSACCTTYQATRWEYKVVWAGSFKISHTTEEWRKNQEALMNDLGKDGWIFMSESDELLYFRRPVK